MSNQSPSPLAETAVSKSLIPKIRSVRWLLGLTIVSTICLVLVQLTSYWKFNNNFVISNSSMVGFILLMGLIYFSVLVTLITIIFGIIILFTDREKLARKWNGIILLGFIIFLIVIGLMMIFQFLGGMNG